jgi:hypothetical protein
VDTGLPVVLTTNHVFVAVEHNRFQCTLCGDLIGDLTERDVHYLNSNGKCPGHARPPWGECFKVRGICQHDECHHQRVELCRPGF